MATQQETVILEIDLEKSIRAQAELNLKIAEQKKLLKELEEQISLTNEENQERLDQIETEKIELKQLQNEYKGLSRINDGYIKTKKLETDTTNFNNNSIKENRALLQQMKEQYIGLKNPTAESTKNIFKLTEVLKAQEEAMGVTSRNVGNYKQAILDALRGVNLFGGTVGSVIDPLKKAQLGFMSAGGGIKGFGSGLAGLATGVLPLFAGAIGAGISALTSYGPIADKAEQLTLGLGAGFKALVEGRNILEAADQVIDLTEQLRDLNDEQARAGVGNARNKNEIDALILQSKDRSKSEQERIKFLKEANTIAAVDFEEDIERARKTQQVKEDLFRVNTKLSKDELKLLLEDNEQLVLSEGKNIAEIEQLRSNANKKISKDEREQVKELAKGREDLVKQEGDFQRLRLENVNSISKLQEQIRTEAEQDAEKERKRLEKLAQERKAYLDKLTQLETEFQLGEREKLAKSFDDKLKQVTGNGQRETTLRLDIETAKQQALDKFDSEAEEKRQQRIADRLLKLQEDNKKTREEIELNHELQLELQKTFVASQQQIDDEFDAWIKANPEKRFADFYAFKKKLYEEDTKNQKEAAQKQQEIQDAQLDATTKIAGGLIDVIGSIAEAAGADVEFKKALALIEIIINTATAIAKGVSTSQDLPFPANLAAMATTIAAVTANISQAVALFATTPPTPKFTAAEGIAYDIDGKPHSQGGTPIHVNGRLVGEAQEGERMYILKKEAAEEIRMLSALNQKHGGVSFGNTVRYAAQGGNIAMLTDGGFSARDAVNRVNSANDLKKAMIEAITKLPNPEVSVREINRVNSNMDRTVKVSELG